MKAVRAHRLLVVVAGLAAGLLQAPAQAGGTRSFELDDFRGVADLQLQGASVTALGGLSPGPRQRALAGPSLPVIWDVLATGTDVIAAGGTPGTVLIFPGEGNGRRLHELGETEATALAAGEDGAVLVGLSPGGLIHGVQPDGSSRLLLETGSRYVWDLLADGQGGAWVATGDPGAVLHLPPGGGPVRRLALLGIDQARCLAPAGEGAVWVGTSGHGRVLRVDEQGIREVLLETDHTEVAALAAVPDGGLVAALVSVAAGGPRGAAPETRATSLPPPGGGDDTSRPTEAAGRSEVVRVEPDGAVSRLWAGQGELAISLLARPEGEVWIGTSPGGVVLAVGATGEARRVATLPARSVPALASGSDGVILAGTGGLGGVYALEPGGRRSEGIVVSPVHDASPGARFGQAEWDVQGAGDVALAFRSGGTQRPDGTWSPWSAWHGAGTAPAPVAPPGRFIQWRARLLEGAGEPPRLTRVRVVYLPQNRVPRLERAEVLPPGVVLEPLPAPVGQAGPPAGSAAANALAGDLGGSAGGALRVRRVFQAGRRTVTWDATDEDGDPLVARLLLRADGEPDFLPLAGEIMEGFYVFHEALLSDGGYVVRVEVSDRPGNTAERARTSALETRRFTVDRTPPVIEDLRWRQERGRWVFSFRAADPGGRLDGAVWSLDGAQLTGLLPEDGMEDQGWESYRVVVPANSPGPHVVVVSVRDAAGNESSARLRFLAGP